MRIYISTILYVLYQLAIELEPERILFDNHIFRVYLSHMEYLVSIDIKPSNIRH